MPRITKILAITLTLLLTIASCASYEKPINNESIGVTEAVTMTSSTYAPPIADEVVLVSEGIFEDEKRISDEDIALIALVTMAEAEGECEEGQRLVIDTILNRVDSEYFPDTVHGVVYQPNQFSPMWNGRIERCEVREDICQLVQEELTSRTDYDVMFFTAGQYSEYGVPMFQVENHYFSSYD